MATTYNIQVTEKELSNVFYALHDWEKAHPHYPKYQKDLRELIHNLTVQKLEQDSLDPDYEED